MIQKETPEMPKERVHPYVRIMRAAKAGKGVHLSSQEVFDMSFDDAIATYAENVEFGDVDDKTGERPGVTIDTR